MKATLYKLSLVIVFVFSIYNCTSTFAQHTMRPLNELINTTEPAWPMVQQWIAKAKNKITILPVDTAKANDALFHTQVTTRSPMGAIVHSTGGLLVDNGWIRILGSGHLQLNRSLPDWNKGKAYDDFGQPAPFLLIADDAIGGFFILNGGSLGKDLGKVYYLSPDNLEYEALDLTYTDFLNFCFNNNLDSFYKGYRWKNWQADVSVLTGDKVYNCFPPLWTKEGKNINKVSRKAVPIEEQYNLQLSFRKQLGVGK